ncbi:DNA internalization-related competence protein ComEC/Rec2, partial [Thermodesulfobacteriota bacterium]
IVGDTRCKISDLIDKTAAGKPQNVLKALIVGDRSSIPPDLREAFNRAGVGHLLAISGLHIGIVASGAFIFFVRILSYIKPLLWHARTKKAAVVFSLLPVLFYGLLAGMSPSTQRAVIMVAVFLLSFFFEREQDLVNTLALAAMLVLIINPPALFSISFQLSFIAVLVIIYSLSRVQNPWKSDPAELKKGKLFQIKQKLFYFLAASFFAILGTLPFGMLYFNQISLVGLLANVIIVPLIGSVVVPLGLFAVFLYPLTITGASWFLGTSAKVLAQALAVVEFLAGLPYAAVKTVTPTWFEICLFYLLLWSLLNIKGAQTTSSGRPKIHNMQPRARSATGNEARATTVHRQKLARIIAVAVILAGIGDTLYWCNRRFWHDDLRVTIIDVRHGSSGLIELPRGHNILIDGGGFSDNAVFDIGARIVAPFLWRKKIRTVDTIVLSHPNSDHLNGLIYITEHFNVKEVWTNNRASDTSSYQKFMTVIAKGRIPRPMFKELARSRKINGVCLDILYPPFDFIDRSKREGWRDQNNNSMVIKATLGSISFLFPGDIKARAETELAANFANLLKSTVLLAPHHGSQTSNTDGFLAKVAPEVVIISSGPQSRFGCPHPAVLKRYQKYGFRLLETARHGAVSVSTDGRSLAIKTAIAP